MDSIKLYAYTFVSRAERIIWTLEALDLPYELIRLDPFKGETMTEEFQSLKVPAKIPILQHGELILTESLAIMEYLCSIKDNQLLPQSGQALINFRHAMYTGATEIEANLWVANQKVKLDFLYPWPDGTKEQALANLERNLPVVWSWLDDRDFIAGDTFTMADIYFYQLIKWVKAYNIEISDKAETYLEKLEDQFPFFTKSGIQF